MAPQRKRNPPAIPKAVKQQKADNEIILDESDVASSSTDTLPDPRTTPQKRRPTALRKTVKQPKSDDDLLSDTNIRSTSAANSSSSTIRKAVKHTGSDDDDFLDETHIASTSTNTLPDPKTTTRKRRPPALLKTVKQPKSDNDDLLSDSNIGSTSGNSSIPKTKKSRKAPKELSRFFEFTDLDVDFMFELRTTVRTLTTVSGNKQVLKFNLFDRTGQDFEVTIWEPKCHDVYKVLRDVEAPVYVEISHAKTTVPRGTYTPRSAYKHIQMVIPNHSIVKVSSIHPPKPTMPNPTVATDCDCPTYCDRSCKGIKSSEPWSFKDLAKCLGSSNKTKFFRNIDVSVFGTPANVGGTVQTKITDGVHLAYLECKVPVFPVEEGTEMHFEVFSATIKDFGTDRKALIVIPHPERVIIEHVTPVIRQDDDDDDDFTFLQL